MPITLIRDMTQGPVNGMWRFYVQRTRDGSDVAEKSFQPLSHENVVRIYREVFGAEPADGVKLRDVLENWDCLEPPLRDVIEQLLSPDPARRSPA